MGQKKVAPWVATEAAEPRVGTVGYSENEREIAIMNRKYNKMRFSDENTRY